MTQIVVGKTQHNRLKNILRGGSPTERLIRASGDIDVVVVSAEDHVPQPSRVSLPPIARHSTWRQYALSVGIIAAVTAADLFAPPWFSYLAVGLTELFAVLLIAVYIGRGPALLAASLSALSWNFLFIEPRLTFSINQSQDVILFALYFIIALYTGNLTARLRQQEQQARYNNERNLALYRLAHDVSAAVDMDDVVRIAVEQIGHAFDRMSVCGFRMTVYWTDCRMVPALWKPATRNSVLHHGLSITASPPDVGPILCRWQQGVISP
ncbi:MAG: DUF4118 domain-containing protein [Chloroflexi bacterium]|nr:DUF4118 domain-containing protein [Chloroflexota bacterium]